MKDWTVSWSTIYGVTIALTLFNLAFPGGLQFILPFVGLYVALQLKRAGRLKPFSFLDFILIPTYTVATIIALVSLQIYTINAIPWYTVIFVGIAADVIGSVAGLVPVGGDFVAAVLTVIMLFTVVGGFYGGFMALTLLFIQLIPGPSLGANTAMLALIKIATEAAL